MKLLITGAAGFIGSHLVNKLKSEHEIVIIDNLNNYYNQQLKLDRLDRFCKDVTFIKGDIADKQTIDDLFSIYEFDKVINLAAQAGVRYSIDHPYDYIQSNIVGFMNILEACRHNNVKHLIYASSSSVYGLNEKQPFTEEDKVDRPVSLYAASKKSNELMSHAYSKLYGMHTTGLRFFTVYGPYGRPDMSPTLFANAIANDKPIKVFNNGEMFRDFTYVDDIVNGIANIVNSDQPINEDNLYYGIYNIGCGHKEKLLDFISEIEKAFGKEVQKEFLPMQLGDVVTTYASTEKLEKDFGYKPQITIKEGIPKFINWYKEYYNIKNEEN